MMVGTVNALSFAAAKTWQHRQPAATGDTLMTATQRKAVVAGYVARVVAAWQVEAGKPDGDGGLWVVADAVLSMPVGVRLLVAPALARGLKAAGGLWVADYVRSTHQAMLEFEAGYGVDPGMADGLPVVPYPVLVGPAVEAGNRSGDTLALPAAGRGYCEHCPGQGDAPCAVCKAPQHGFTAAELGLSDDTVPVGTGDMASTLSGGNGA